jgi:FAD/FMN-containing dehydrogenase
MMVMDARSTVNDSLQLDESAINSLAGQLQGQLIRPGDAGYDAARAVWNGMIDRRPAIIARCVSERDVIAAVNFAREQGVPLSVRGGGHHVAGSAVIDNGLVIDLSRMKAIRVEAEARAARAQAGVNWGELDAATQLHGLAAPGGVVSDTGIAGLTLGGGLGWLRRKYGLSSDSLIAADVVTADGKLLRASPEENADLYWALRGGGGNFGIVTSFEYRLHPVGPEVMFAFVLYPASHAPELLKVYRTHAAITPDEVSSFAIFGTTPAAPPYPEAAHGEPYLAFMSVYAGPPEEGEPVLQPLRECGRPLVDLSGRLPFVDVQKVFDEDYPAGKLRYYWKSIYLNNLNDDAIDTLTAQGARRPSPHSTIDIWQLGGAMNRVDPAATAFSPRKAPFLIGIEANWDHVDDDVENIEWARETYEALLPFSEGGEYINFPGLFERGEDGLRAAFGTNYERLAAVKRKYDPNGLFRLNPNNRG